ncbi:molybdate transport system substrate-binding protein [Lebetimonas natsushimae]|uniref:Molybdate transport system substrate-binding protein n=1 Tax=Lebetimonas natsushimae TaxID=1936991 RepID=A0A292YD58_9BACT|nr:substrate-binding domain-containing protein [Lebetimonas natsushimae]GAX87628.1 molybdate transport system substrate-binding protein [Lebetimonas natsushimae]
MKKIILLIISVKIFANCIIGITGGYKEIFKPLLKQYNSIHKEKINVIYGPLGTLIANAKFKNIAMIFGEKETLKENNFKNFIPIGKDRLTIICKKQIIINKLNNLKLAVPNPKGTIYGERAKEFFNNSKINPKHILTVSMMPQGINYLQMNLVECAVANKAMAIFFKNKYRYLEIKNNYNPIILGFAEIKNNKPCNNFIHFLKSEKIKKYLKSKGICF